MAFECPRRSSPPSPMFDADTGCIATDPAPSARRRFRSKTGIENLPANEHAQETPHTPSPTRTTRRIQSGCAGSRPRLRDGMPGSPSQHIDITRAKWIPYFLQCQHDDDRPSVLCHCYRLGASKIYQASEAVFRLFRARVCMGLPAYDSSNCGQFGRKSNGHLFGTQIGSRSV